MNVGDVIVIRRLRVYSAPDPVHIQQVGVFRIGRNRVRVFIQLVDITRVGLRPRPHLRRQRGPVDFIVTPLAQYRPKFNHDLTTGYHAQANGALSTSPKSTPQSHWSSLQQEPD